jgi:16S rRNA (uracil1498-N3)-methyltransferase
MRRFYAPPDKFGQNSFTLEESETRHLRDVLRLKIGDNVNVFDGEGREFECRIEDVQKRSTDLSILREVPPTALESSLDLSICATILKGDRTDFAVQKLVELGVTKFIPMLTVRCDVKPKDVARRVERWRKIAFEAAKQCGRAKLMTIGEVVGFETAIRSDAAGKILFSERDGDIFKADQQPSSLTAFLGPEGGWDDSELELGRKLEIPIFTLHGRIMKADTAAVAISAILQHRFGDLN